MNVQTITISREVAEGKLAAYEAQLKRRSDPEYEALAAAYRVAAEGRPILNLLEVFRETGLGGDYRPKLAVARADRRQVRFGYVCQGWTHDGFLEFNTLKRSSWQYSGSLLISIPFPNPNQVNPNTLPVWKHPETYPRDGYALVPLVPAEVRPQGQLKDYFVLWEVEQWSDSPIRATPDRDPYLLRHIWGDLYEVVAEWELTELERQVMAGRREG